MIACSNLSFSVKPVWLEQILPSRPMMKLQAENPDEPPVREVMQRLGAIGLPTYVILKPKR